MRPEHFPIERLLLGAPVYRHDKWGCAAVWPLHGMVVDTPSGEALNGDAAQVLAVRQVHKLVLIGRCGKRRDRCLKRQGQAENLLHGHPPFATLDVSEGLAMP